MNTRRGTGFGGREIIPLTTNPHTLQFDYGEKDKYVTQEAEKVLSAIGGVRHNSNAYVWFEFDYDPTPVVKLITVSGVIPDYRAHQYYPTPGSLADRALELAGINSTDTCLEPSAGTGAIADKMPKERTTCIEVNALHAAVLEQKGHTVKQ